jgi:hypothetical protein
MLFSDPPGTGIPGCAGLGVTLTATEAERARLLAEQLARSATARDQAAASSIYLETLLAECRRHRARLPISLQNILARIPRYARSVVFHLDRAGWPR